MNTIYNNWKYIIVIIIALIIGYFIWNYFTVTKGVGVEIKRQLNYYITAIFGQRTDEMQKYRSFEIPFVHQVNEVDKPLGTRKSRFWSAAAVVDLDNSGHEAIFQGGGKGQDDALLIYNPSMNKIVNMIDGTGLSSLETTYSVVSIDMDKDGWSDLLIARDSGLYLFKNNGDMTFTKKLILPSNDKYGPVAIAIADYNKDGEVDIYASTFINAWLMKAFQFNNPDHATPNVLLKNNGDGTFTDITQDVGNPGQQNTFTSAFIDLNKDGFPDLVVSPDTGEVEIYENKQGEEFVRKPTDSNYGFWMGIAQGDYDNDGDIDLYLTNLGNSVPQGKEFRGDLKDDQVLNYYHVLLRNDGDFKLVNVAQRYGVDKLPFGWGAIFEDLDKDGKQDLLFSTNYLDYPPHKLLKDDSVVLMNTSDGFIASDKYTNRTFSQTPLMVDIDGDGIKDLYWVNIHSPPKLYKIERNLNNFINVQFQNHPMFLNSQVIVKTPMKTFYQELSTAGIGFASDQSKMLTFGLGNEKEIDQVRVRTIYGNDIIFDHPEINTTLSVDVNNVKVDEENKQITNIPYKRTHSWRRFDHLRY